jgi:hypothetical protein
MIDERFVILGAAISLAGGVGYIIDTLRGRIQPNKVTWLIWGTIPLIAFVAEMKQGVGLIALITFMSGFQPLLVFLASFVNKRAYWKISQFDIYCGIVAVVGVVLWQVTGVGSWAILLSIIADSGGSIPTIVKAYKAPETENPWAFLASAVGAIISMLTIRTWDFAHYAFPVYILVVVSSIFLLVRFRLGKRLAAYWA